MLYHLCGVALHAGSAEISGTRVLRIAAIYGLLTSAEYFDRTGYPEGEIAGWSDGDWNGDGVFDSSDMVTAFVDGGYEKKGRGRMRWWHYPLAVFLPFLGVIPGGLVATVLRRMLDVQFLPGVE